jgi:acyl carrier protein
MTDAEIRALILELICELAPEADPAAARDQDDIREVFDLDSMDFTNLIVGIHERAKVDIPETDYNKLFKLGDAVAYLRDALARPAMRG